MCAQCEKKHLGVCKLGTNVCYLYDKEGHCARNCILNNQNPKPQFPNKNSDNQLLVVQAKIEGLSITQERLEAPEPQTQNYAYTKGDIEAGTSSVGTC